MQVGELKQDRRGGRGLQALIQAKLSPPIFNLRGAHAEPMGRAASLFSRLEPRSQTYISQVLIKKLYCVYLVGGLKNVK